MFMKKELHYFCVRFPELEGDFFNIYQHLGGNLYQTQAPSGKKAANNVIYRHGGDNRNLISKTLHEKFDDLSKYALDLDKISNNSCQYTFWDKETPKKLNEKVLADKIKTKLGARLVNGEEDCLMMAREYLHYRLGNHSNQ